MDGENFRTIALSLEGVEQGSHGGAIDFRVGGRIFATLAAVKQGYGNLLLTPELQSEFIAEAPQIFLPVAGGWGRNGFTHIRLDKADHAQVEGALCAAWRLRIQKNSQSRNPRRIR